MKRFLLIVIVLSSSLFGLNGQEVFETKCISCHQFKNTMGIMVMSSRKAMFEKMKNSSEEEKRKLRQKMQEKVKNSGMKAPPMPMISMRVKMMTSSKEEFVSFVKEYIQNPSKEKGFCMPMAYENFGVMPAVGKNMSPKERDLVAGWLYDNFDDKWGESMGGMMCGSEMKTTKK